METSYHKRKFLHIQAKKFDILDEIQESFFQFSPDLVKEKIEGFGEHEPWDNKQIGDEVFTPFVLQTDMRSIGNEELLANFLSFIEKMDT